MQLLSSLLEFLYSVDVGNPGGSSIGLTPPTIDSVLGKVFVLVNGFLFTLAPAALVAMIAYAGIMRMFAADNPQGIKQSTQVLVYAIIGYIVTVAGFLIIGLALGVVNFTGGIGSLFQLNLPKK